MASQTPAVSPSVILFDGDCALCHRSVNFIIDRDPAGHFRFAPLVSPAAQQLLQQAGLVEAPQGTMVLVERGRVFGRSTAALRIARRLSGLWPALFGLILVPRPLRDWVYDAVARRRHRLSAGHAACRLPSDDRRARFLS